MNPDIIGEIIRSRRKTLGLTQQQTAGLCGVGVTFLSRIERGQSTAEIGKVLHVLNALGLKVQIFDGESE